MALFGRNKEDTGWEGIEEGPLRGWPRLKEAISEKYASAREQISSLISRGGQGFSSRVLTSGEIILDLSSTRIGKIVTSAVCLTLAWLLL